MTRIRVGFLDKRILIGSLLLLAGLLAWYGLTHPARDRAVNAMLRVGTAAIKQVHTTMQDRTLRRIFMTHLAGAAPTPKPVHPLRAEPAKTLLPRLRDRAVTPAPFAASNVPGVMVARRRLTSTGAAGHGFTRMAASDLGIVEPSNFSINQMMLGLQLNRGIASGDVHNDGWPDILLTSEAGLILYANLGGERFVRQAIDVPALDTLYVTSVSLVDLDADGWLDVFFATFFDGNYVIFNDEGRFLVKNLQRLPNHARAIHTSSIAFGDVNRDGDLDIVLGNEFASNRGLDQGYPAAANALLLKEPGEERARYTLHSLSGHDGETLSMHLTDIDGDGNLDLLVGNDFRAPDLYYRGDGAGKFDPIMRYNGIIPYSGTSTMSFSSADVDNDLVPEIYVAQISRSQPSSRLSAAETCAEVPEPDQREACRLAMDTRNVLRAAGAKPLECLAIRDQDLKNQCLALYAYRWATRKGGGRTSICLVLLEARELLGKLCGLHQVSAPPLLSALENAHQVPSVSDRNVLLARGKSWRFTDRAGKMGIAKTGWAWNAKFADLDNDMWQDLYVANGYVHNLSSDRNVFFRNEGGVRFTDQTDAFGLGSWLDTYAYTYVDFDRDGDLDIIAASAAGPVSVFVNDTNNGRAIVFELQDAVGNRFGIGSSVIIRYGPEGQLHQMREMQASGGFNSFDPPVVHFGLGPYVDLTKVVVTWSTGERSTLRGNFQAGYQYVLRRETRRGYR